jgi:ParB family chromosome partitioning protein
MGEATPQAGIQEVPIDRLVPNPWQPRQDLREEALQELAASIREHGLIQPLIVTQTHDGYQIIAGERRWRAARLAGLQTVPVIVKEASERDKLELALVENLQRADLNPLEEALAYQQLIREFGLTQTEIARRVGKSQAAISNALRLLRLPDGVKRALAAGEISEGHARALIPLEDEELQLVVVERIRQEGLNVRQVERLVRRLLATPPEARAVPSQSAPEVEALEDEFQGALGTKVRLLWDGRGGGRLVIYFYSEEELQALYDLIVER